MKRSVTLLMIIALSLGAAAQSPQRMSYQCVVRNAAGALVTNHAVGMNISILQGSATGTVVFAETYSPVPQTNANGLVTVEIGSGTASVGTFAGINWANGPYYLKTETDPAGGTSYTITGTSQLLSVPYALHAKTSEDRFSGSYDDLTNKPALFDGVFASLTGKPTTLAGYGISNAMSTSHPANVITPAYITNWNTAFGWGNHAGLYRPVAWMPSWSEITGSPFLLNADSVYTMRNMAIGSNLPKKAQLSVVSEDDTSDDPLFEVRRKDGQPVFTVYNDAVTINVSNNPSGKGSPQRGGFAVGGFDETKGSMELFRVTYDSVRININNNPSVIKGSPQRGGFAIGGFDETKQEQLIYFDVSPNTGDIIDPSENRILWYPIKNALLTGKVLIQDPDSVGVNSFASGFESKAKGEFSQALGYKAVARGLNSTSIGYQSIAHKDNSFAFGQYAQALNEECYALGRGAMAEGFRSFAFGSSGVDSSGVVTGVTYAKGDYSFAIGQGSQALGKGSFTLGLADTARGDYSVAIGYQTSASGFGSTSLGGNTSVSGVYSTAMGYGSDINGFYSTAMGYFASAGGTFSTAIGYYPVVTGDFATSLGSHTNASANFSTAIGGYSTASAWYATAIGGGSTAGGAYSSAIGYNASAGKLGTNAIGYYAAATADWSTAMGYYAAASGDFSLSLGFGTTASGHSSTAIGVSTVASGGRSTAMGYNTAANGTYSTALGYSTTATGNMSTVMGYSTVSHSDYETVIGRLNTNYTPVAPPGADWNGADRIFVIGIGSSDAARANAMTVLKSGRVGLQTVTSPTYALELPNSSTAGVGQARAYAWVTYSDGRAKSDLNPLSYGLEEVMMLEPQTYLHHGTTISDNGLEIETEGNPDIGLVAQQVYKIIPEAVNKPENESSELWSMSYHKLIPVLINAVKEQQHQIEATEAENRQLQLQIQSMQQRMEQIEAALQGRQE